MSCSIKVQDLDICPKNRIYHVNEKELEIRLGLFSDLLNMD